MIRDGIHSWLEGSKHVAYGDGKYDAQGAKCPPTHPKRIMSLLYEFTFVVSSLVSSSDALLTDTQDAAEYNEGSRKVMCLTERATLIIQGILRTGTTQGTLFTVSPFLTPGEYTDPSADFTTGWKAGFFQDIFDQGRECSVQFALDECGPLALNATAREGQPLCPYKGVQVVEVSFQFLSRGRY